MLCNIACFAPQNRQRYRLERGFTLIELSIVLVIIGMIVGGIVGGQSLIRASEIRSVVTDTQDYMSAYNQFLEKYRYRPGDLPNATDYWGAADPNAVLCRTTVGVGTQTCNGNGDGMVNYNTNEEFRAWQQLANAGFIGGQYTGVGTGIGNYEATPGSNVPASRLTNVGYSMYYLNEVTVNTWATYEYVGKYGNVLVFGSFSANNKTKQKALTPAEALSVDLKMDDGLPGLGNVRTMKGGGGWNPNCATATDPNTSRYKVSFKEVSCMLYFIIEN